MTQNNQDHKPLDLASLRQRLSGKKGKDYWRSLNELAHSEEFDELVQQEFPRQAGLLDFLNRRDFLKVLGASLALAGLTACAPRENELILPYVRPPEELVPANSTYFASSMVQDGFAKGVLIETTMGRPIKVEGNPKHPDSLGSTDVFMQASILELYDPERAQHVLNQGTQKTWQDFTAAAGTTMSGVGQGAGLRILTGPVTSPTLNAQLTALLDQYPQAKWYQYNPLGRGNITAGTNMAFGQSYDAVYNFLNADVILSLDSDFLFTEPGHLRYSYEFSRRHQPLSINGVMNRLYVVESSMSITGSNADHRLAVRPSQVEAFARAIASRLGVNVSDPAEGVPGQSWLDALAEDLQKAGGAALVVAGERQPPAVHALAFAMNQALGSIGNTVALVDPVVYGTAAPNASLNDLVQELNSGAVDTLLILEGNPAYSAPADLNFSEAMQKARQSIYLGYYPDETSLLATWFVPSVHYMEMWGDARAYDGTVSLIQPVIQPLFGGKSSLELIAALMGQADARGYDLVRAYWQDNLQAANFDSAWRAILSNGVVPNTAAQPTSVDAAPQLNDAALGSAPVPVTGNLEVVFEPDLTIWDGRFTNNAWLQELPKPLTKLTWDNAALISPTTALRLGLADDEVVLLKLGNYSVEAPVYIEPGQPDDVVVVTLGYGRKAGGSLLLGQGYNAYAIRTSDAPWFASGLEVTKTGKKYTLAATHEHWTMENRNLVREATLEEYLAHPNFAQELEGENFPPQPPTLYGEYPYAERKYQWGMAINLSTCIGCNACVLACQAENNIPTVGKDGVLRGREMHWLRVDRYYTGAVDNPEVRYEPVPCMHCEKAPCEPVCPVEATSHSVEGINEMTYNRCVGTRYCSNNCPYKVRRFNFFNYVDTNIQSLRARKNPDVTVRMRGVMEKCTYCIQRINHARADAEVAGRAIGDGDVKTACQEACPTHAIVFGNINDKNSEVRHLKELPLNYGLLAELGTQPRTTYLAKVKNSNPLITEQA